MISVLLNVNSFFIFICLIVQYFVSVHLPVLMLVLMHAQKSIAKLCRDV